MSKGYQIGTKVKWKWGNGFGEGQVTERFTEKVTRTIKGSEITRSASKEEPAYLIKQEDGDRVLKSHSEIEKSA
ncbi:MAG: DUF2945 domain-containing protein [Planctomycetaceae bacterium]